MTASLPAPEQASNVSSSLSRYSSSQQELTNRKLSTTGPCYLDCINIGHCEQDTEPCLTSDLGKDLCLRTIDALERAKDATKDASTAEGKSAALEVTSYQGKYKNCCGSM